MKEYWSFRVSEEGWFFVFVGSGDWIEGLAGWMGEGEEKKKVGFKGLLLLL